MAMGLKWINRCESVLRKLKKTAYSRGGGDRREVDLRGSRLTTSGHTIKTASHLSLFFLHHCLQGLAKIMTKRRSSRKRKEAEE